MTIIALTKSDVSPQGPTHANAHHVITRVNGDPKQGGALRVTVGSFASKADYDAGKTTFCERHFTFAMDYNDPNTSKNLLDFLYGLLKTEAVQNSGFFSSGTTDVTVP